MSSEARRRNPRGKGDRLAADLVAAAGELLAETGDEAGLSLRQVARQAGVSAPAVYLHFDSKGAVVEAVLDAQFSVLTGRITAAIEQAADDAAALRDGCSAYLRFAREEPGFYRVLFGGRTSLGLGDGDVSAFPGREAFGSLLEAVSRCQDTGAIPRGEPLEVATLIWIGLHGTATLRQARPAFPWPREDELLDELLERLAQLPKPQGDRHSRPPQRRP